MRSQPEVGTTMLLLPMCREPVPAGVLLDGRSLHRLRSSIVSAYQIALKVCKAAKLVAQPLGMLREESGRLNSLLRVELMHQRFHYGSSTDDELNAGRGFREPSNCECYCCAICSVADCVAEECVQSTFCLTVIAQKWWVEDDTIERAFEIGCRPSIEHDSKREQLSYQEGAEVAQSHTSGIL